MVDLKHGHGEIDYPSFFTIKLYHGGRIENLNTEFVNYKRDYFDFCNVDVFEVVAMSFPFVEVEDGNADEIMKSSDSSTDMEEEVMDHVPKKIKIKQIGKKSTPKKISAQKSVMDIDNYDKEEWEKLLYMQPLPQIVKPCTRRPMVRRRNKNDIIPPSPDATSLARQNTSVQCDSSKSWGHNRRTCHGKVLIIFDSYVSHVIGLAFNLGYSETPNEAANDGAGMNTTEIVNEGCANQGDDNEGANMGGNQIANNKGANDGNEPV
ncbi:hypothetical protein AgCh_029539 [Apium graveolens]